MPDDRDIDRDLDDLRHLAPDIDTDAARTEFGRRRSEDRPPRWPLVAAAAVVLVLLAGGFAIAANEGDDDTVVSGPTGDDGEAGATLDFDVLTVNAAVVDMGTLMALTEEGLAPEFWDQTGAPAPYPSVDLDTHALVAITIPDDACPPDLVRFDQDGSTYTPAFVEPSGGCDEPLIPKTYVVRFAWAPLEPAFTIRLPANDTYGFDEQLLTVERHEPSPASSVVEPVPEEESTCEQIEAFAEVVARPSAIANYDASVSPAELADRSDLVLYGRLTGRTEVDEGDVGDLPDDGSAPAFPTVGFEVEIDAVYKSPPGAELAPVVPIWVTHVGPVDAIESAADKGVAGLPVAVFAFHDDENSVFRAGVEGFVTACPDGPLLGFPFQGEWTTIPSLDALNARLEEYANP